MGLTFEILQWGTSLTWGHFLTFRQTFCHQESSFATEVVPSQGMLPPLIWLRLHQIQVQIGVTSGNRTQWPLVTSGNSTHRISYPVTSRNSTQLSLVSSGNSTQGPLVTSGNSTQRPIWSPQGITNSEPWWPHQGIVLSDPSHLLV